jgi:hypothetical protein
MKRDGCVALPGRLLRHRSGRLAPASLAATSLTPLPMMRWHKPVQRTSLAGFAVVAAWLVVPPRAVAQNYCSNDGGTYSCNIPSGTFTSNIYLSAPLGTAPRHRATLP